MLVWWHKPQKVTLIGQSVKLEISFDDLVACSTAVYIYIYESVVRCNSDIPTRCPKFAQNFPLTINESDHIIGLLMANNWNVCNGLIFNYFDYLLDEIVVNKNKNTSWWHEFYDKKKTHEM